MRYIILVLLCQFCLDSQAQTRRFEIMAGVGNNGQVEKALNEYFYPEDPLYLLDEAQTAEATSFKYNISGKLNISERISLRLRYGKSKTNNSYYYSSPDLFGNFAIEQDVVNYNPAICINENLGKFKVSTGIELAFYKVKDFHFKFKGTDYFIWVNNKYSRFVESDYVMEGGRVTGINNFLEFQYSATSRFGMGASVSYGMMFAKFGDRTKETVSYVYPPGLGLNSNGPVNIVVSEDKKYKKSYFSSPEILVFLFFRFGKALGS
jgi:hypothetical protein